MSGETGQLQKLTDQMVSARLAAYNAGGSLDRKQMKPVAA